MNFGARAGVHRRRRRGRSRRSARSTRRCAAASPCGSRSSCARARSATSSRAAPWTRSTSGSSSRRWTTSGRTIFHSGAVDGRRQGAGRARRALLPQPAARRARQPDQQAQRLGRALGRLRAPDPARRRRHDPLPAADPGRLRRARSRCARRSTTASSRGGTRSGRSPACAIPARRRTPRSRRLRRRHVGVHGRHVEGVGRR